MMMMMMMMMMRAGTVAFLKRRDERGVDGVCGVDGGRVRESL